MLSTLDISTSALVAQRTRLNAISSNLANMSTVLNEDGEMDPYKPRFVVFQPDDSISPQHGVAGVKVSAVKTKDVEPLWKHQPQHPLADERGNVAYPRVNMIEEFVDAVEATRAYEANIGVMEITKNLGEQSLRIIA